MKSSVEHIRENKAASANQSRRSADRYNAMFHYVDNRPATHQLNTLQKTLDDSPEQFMRWADNNTTGTPVHSLQFSAESDPVQRQGGMEEEELLQGKRDPAQRQGALEDEELMQGKLDPLQRLDMEEEELLQGKFHTRSVTQLNDNGDAVENHTGMPDSLKAGMEQLSGMDMSGVRVHYNSDKPAQVNAHAYAQGQDIHLGPGQARHLPHEAWHTVQQMQGRVRPTMQTHGVSINDDKGLENEADVMGEKALQMSRNDETS